MGLQPALPARRSGAAPLLLATAAVLALSAAYVRHRTRRAEREHPPSGRFVSVGGVRLHYREQGSGPPLVLLHGNGSLADEFDVCGMLQEAAERYRVIAFDRPGYGYSERPADVTWTPEAQADLIHAALEALDIRRPVVLGHSWGAQVALALGLRHPQAAQSLVLMSGYYFPTLRVDVPLLAVPAIPLIGTLLRHTLSPLISRLLWPAMTRHLFAPAPVTRAFRQRFPTWLALRPSQLRASAAESALLIPAAFSLRPHYPELEVPAVVMAGAADRHVDPYAHSVRLHQCLPRSTLRLAQGAGHMVHHVARGDVMAAIDAAAALGERRRRSRDHAQPVPA